MSQNSFSQKGKENLYYSLMHDASFYKGHCRNVLLFQLLSFGWFSAKIRPSDKV